MVVVEVISLEFVKERMLSCCERGVLERVKSRSAGRQVDADGRS